MNKREKQKSDYIIHIYKSFDKSKKKKGKQNVPHI